MVTPAQCGDRPGRRSGGSHAHPLAGEIRADGPDVHSLDEPAHVTQSRPGDDSPARFKPSTDDCEAKDALSFETRHAQMV